MSAGDATDVGAARGGRRFGEIGWVLLRLALSAGAVGLVLTTVDVDAALKQVGGQDLQLAFFALLALLVQGFVGAVRWHAVRRGLRSADAFRSTLAYFFVGSFFSSFVLTGVAGDVMRGWLAYRGGDGRTVAAYSVILDRVVVIGSIAILIAASLPWFLAHKGAAGGGWLPLILAVVFAAGVVAVAQLRRLSAHSPSRLVRGLHTVGAAVRDVLLRPRAAAGSLSAGVVAQVLLAVATYLLAQSAGVQISFLDCLVLMQVVALVTAIPISIGGWGVREAAIIALLGPIGVPASAAFLLSVQLGLLGLVANLPGGVIWTGLRNSRPRDDSKLAGAGEPATTT